jgi:anti-sigma B factor antagonist
MPDMSIGGFTIREEERDGVVVLSLDRDLKGSGEAALKVRLDDLVRQGRLEILINLAAMPFVDSSELGRLIRSHLSVRQAGGRVRLCNLVPRVVELMKMTKLDTVFEIYASEEEALAEIQGSRQRSAPEN